jgi:hypothetical protein
MGRTIRALRGTYCVYLPYSHFAYDTLIWVDQDLRSGQPLWHASYE